MTISEMIAVLEDVKKFHGDVTVVQYRPGTNQYDSMDGWYPSPICVEWCGGASGGFYVASRLEAATDAISI